MNTRAYPARLALGLIAWSLAACLPGARAEPLRQQPLVLRPALLPDARIHQRLIIKLKDVDASLDAPLQRRNAQLAIAGLGNRIASAVEGSGSVPLSLHRSIWPGLHVARTGHMLKRAEMQQLIEQLNRDPRVEYAEIDERIYPQAIPNDEGFGSSQWNLWLPEPGVEGGANLPADWYSMYWRDVVVAVIDTGIRPHRDLANVLPGYDFVSDPSIANDGDDGWDDNPGDPGDWISLGDKTQAIFAGCDFSPSSWHGTSVAGTIAAVSNNVSDIAGIAPAARILPVRVFGKCGGYISDVIAGLSWSVGIIPDAPAGSSRPPDNPHPARVINLSMGAGGSCSRSFQQAINQARASGAVVIAAAGNRTENNTALTQPANCDGVIAVTAHTRRGDLASYSNLGRGATLSAPGGGTGVQLNSADWIIALTNSGDTGPVSDDLGYMAGTSIAAAHVSGVAALLLGRQLGWSPAQVELALTESARAYPTDSYCNDRQDCGAGMLDATDALRWQQANSDPYVPPENTSSGGGGGGAAHWRELLLLLSAALLTRFRRNPLASRQSHDSGSAQAARESRRV